MPDITGILPLDEEEKQITENPYAGLIKDPLVAQYLARKMQSQQQFNPMMAQALDAQSRGQLLAGLGQAGQTFATAMTGTKPIAPEFFSDQARAASLPVQQISALKKEDEQTSKLKDLLDQLKLAKQSRDSQRLTDPKDPTAIAQVKMLQDAGIAVPTGATLEQLKNWQPSISAIASKQRTSEFADTKKQIAEESRDFQAHKNAMDKMQNDPTIKNAIKGVNGLDSAMASLTARVLPPEQFSEAQQAVRQAISAGRGGQTGVSERAEDYFKSKGISLARIQSWLTDKPIDIGQQNEFIQHLSELAQIMKDEFKTQGMNAIEKSTKPYGYVYERHPEYLKGKVETMDELEKQLSGSPIKIRSQAAAIPNERSAQLEALSKKVLNDPKASIERKQKAAALLSAIQKNKPTKFAQNPEINQTVR